MYMPKWTSLGEALEYLEFTADDERARFKKLQKAVRDRAIAVRARGRAAERDRALYWRRGLSNDPDYAEQVDASWREMFLDADPEHIDLAFFCEAFEVNRENLVECFSAKGAYARASVLPEATADQGAATNTDLSDRYPGRPSI
jgi:hypothetical protein